MSSDDIFDYEDGVWDKKNLAPELILTNYKYDLISHEHSLGLFTMPLFSKALCDSLVERLKVFDNWTTDRHENYPTNDILIDEFDNRFAAIYDATIYNIMRNALNKLYDCEVNTTFKHETFIIRYKPELQSHLDMHHDHSSFTFCTTLSDESDYVGGGTWFPKHNLVLKGKQGEVTIHPGMFTHRHGVKPIISGERYAIVSFCKINFD